LRETAIAIWPEHNRELDARMAGTIHVLNGPNLNLLGTREPEVYGHATLADVEALCRAEAEAAGFAIDFRQTNAEHEMVEWIQQGRTGLAGMVINPAAFSYAAYPVLDALKMVECPVVEVHISNIHRREEAWRKDTIMTAAVTGVISGLGIAGYGLAVRYLAGLKQC
jgi:3-dehydroquinate dehydratase-2